MVGGAAMYASKRNGRNLASRFSGDGVPADAGHRIGLLTDLHSAIRRGEFFLEYQPIRTSTDMDIEAVEALIRWRRPNGEIVPPNVFIPLAEQSRLIVDIGRWVVRQACHDLARLRAAGLAGVRVHVNMAAPEFIDAELPDRLAALAKISKSQKTIPAAIEFVDIAGLVKGASQGEGLGNQFLSHIREVDAIVQVVRSFEGGEVHHVAGAIDPVDAR